MGRARLGGYAGTSHPNRVLVRFRSDSKASSNDSQVSGRIFNVEDPPNKKDCPISWLTGNVTMLLSSLESQQSTL